MSSDKSSEVALEFSTINYARAHCLAIDYLTEPLPFSHIEVIQKSVSKDPAEDTGLFNITSHAYVNTEEYLTVDEGGARILQHVHNELSSSEEIEPIISTLLDVRKIKGLRLETPLLLTDHETDFKDFAQWEESHYVDGCLPMEPLNDEMDVGLGWPKLLHVLPAEVLKRLQAETLELSKDALLHLQVELKGRWTEEDEREVWENVISYNRNTALEPVTPPLLASSPPLMPYIHSSPDGILPLLSDPASLVSEDARKAEEAIFDNDKLSPPTGYISSMFNSSHTLSEHNNINPSDTCSEAELKEGGQESLFPLYSRAEGNKIEVPLTPPLPIAALSKSVTFSEYVEEMLLDSKSNGDEGKLSVGPSEIDLDRFFQDAFGEAADCASRVIEQEQLQEADANGRVEVPIMDFSLPKPPWEQLEMLSQSTRLPAAQKFFIAEIRREFGWLPVWPGINKVIPKLRWTVFASELAKVEIDESIEDNDAMATFLNPQTEYVVGSEGLTWKPPGLRMLKGDISSDEDDIETGSFDCKQPQDVLSLVKKRKMKYLEENNAVRRGVKSAYETSHPPLANSYKIQITSPAKNTLQSAALNIYGEFVSAKNMLKSTPKKEIIIDNPFCAAEALDNFLEIRAAKRQKPVSSIYFAGNTEDKGTLAATVIDFPDQINIPKSSRAIRQSLPIPKVMLPSAPTPYVISSTIFKRRNFIRVLARLIPNAVPVERDFGVHNMTIWNPNSVTRSPVTSPLDSEADLIISPSTGIVLTTLQKIKQKPLPGQKSKPAFKQRLERISLRYERVVVLVSEGCPDESTNGLSGFDTLALAELIGFCGSLETNATVQFVGGGEEILAEWVAAIMAQYSLRGGTIIPLLQDESLWELFLRRAGMNAFAAQALIALVKAPEGVEPNSPTKAGMFGITALVEMGPQERMKRFEQMIGGRVLTRVARILDENWS